ncbi:response regulator [Flavobacteriaceae bacterium R38]|nr:response regulator [Flavobacteriaceae bacterium R38]
MKVIIVDDEPKAITLISSYLSHFSDFELVQTFRNGLKALEFLNTNAVDVIFLDINMPHLSGLSISKMIPKDTAIVFTTAYAEYAVESYTINAFDYLLKPISLERFSKTISKLTAKFNTKNTIVPVNTESKTIFIKSGLVTHQVALQDISYLEKDGNYIYYVTADTKIMARETIAEALQNLTGDFIQIQKSYIVNFKKIETIETDFITIRANKLPIGSQYKNKLISKMNSEH